MYLIITNDEEVLMDCDIIYFFDTLEKAEEWIHEEGVNECEYTICEIVPVDVWRVSTSRTVKKL